MYRLLKKEDRESSSKEFLEISLTKDSSLLLHAIQSTFYSLSDFEENQIFLVLKILTKNPRKKKTVVYSLIAFCRMENEDSFRQNSSLRRLSFYSRNLY